MAVYKNASWDEIKGYSSRIFIVDIHGPRNMHEVDGVDRSELLHASQFIEHDSNNDGKQAGVTVHTIVEKAIDNKNNLILFVRSENVDDEK